MDDPCSIDPTMVACTGEDLGRAYDVPDAPVSVPTTEVGTVAPDVVLAHTGQRDRALWAPTAREDQEQDGFIGEQLMEAL